ncbi:unnamed protein product [Zymoseptoria tritici ST99CH_1A5]|uniref:NOT2/NOT3/NOT5 C-terminal domain-containing protein n=4 Tax=Zymoseptoria tritici TaxID=1047171 RepID=A0A1X7RTZ3_ZYMT9|nr:unnamed protein product [Zymoseptoria tritici ST99CH_3D7]SMR52841.1 unnamed protein product [Zymoseptoria tritici ST99CH_1E4]SMR54214.1 unnamed protein product [Zymoseptoria tritici ST99CH_3D1]SMY24584.1 unnamed protein product [Zymoseptoria tritici ST99CH_1A5]
MNARSGGQQPLRGMAMNQYGTQPNSRQTPRLQNTQKTGLGNGNAGAGWAFGAPATGNTFGGLAGGAPGLAQGRPQQLSGFAQVMGGGSGQGPIDMSDFPTLSTGPGARPQQNSGWNSNVIRQPPQQQQQQSQAPPQQHSAQRAPSTAPSHQSMDQFDGPRNQPAGDRGGNIGDEFPPLSGQVNGGSIRPSNGFSDTLESPEPAHPQPNGQQTQLPIRNASNNFQQSQQDPSTSAPQNQSQSQSQSNQTPSSTQPASGVKKWADMSDQEHFGLMGLSAIFEARKQYDLGGQPDATIPPEWSNSVLGMGQDLNTLGMDLDSSEPLYPTFHVFPDATGTGSMYDSRSRHPVPAFEVPTAYMVTNVPPMHSRINAFSDETLFQVFYTAPRDVAQELAAQELSIREWRWHKVLRQWLQKDTREANTGALPVVDLANGAPMGVAPVRLTDRTERGVYIFFEPSNWRRERREIILDYDQLDQRHVDRPAGAQMNGMNAAVGPTAGGAFGAPPGMTGSGAVANQQSLQSLGRETSIGSGA